MGLGSPNLEIGGEDRESRERWTEGPGRQNYQFQSGYPQTGRGLPLIHPGELGYFLAPRKESCSRKMQLSITSLTFLTLFYT